MDWKTIANSLTADASDMNDNFNLVRAGTMEPRTSAGASFVTTDSAYDIGSDSARWNNVYCNNVNAAGSITTADNSLWVLEAETTLSAPATSIVFTGLNGDDVMSYMVIARMVSVTTTSTKLMRFWLTEDDTTGSDYGNQIISAIGASVGASRSVSSYHIPVFQYMGTGSQGALGLARLIIYSKTGNERTGVYSWMKGNGTSVQRLVSSSFIWSDTSTTITAMNFSAGGIDDWGAGTNIQLWGRK